MSMWVFSRDWLVVQDEFDSKGELLISGLLFFYQLITLDYLRFVIYGFLYNSFYVQFFPLVLILVFFYLSPIFVRNNLTQVFTHSG